MVMVSNLLVFAVLLNMAFVDFERPSFEQCVESADYVVQAEFKRIIPIENEVAATLRADNPFPQSLKFSYAEFSTKCCIKGKAFPESVRLPILVRRAEGVPLKVNASWELVLLNDNIGVTLPDRVASVECTYILCVKEQEPKKGADGESNRYALVSSGLYQQQSVKACVDLF